MTFTVNVTGDGAKHLGRFRFVAAATMWADRAEPLVQSALKQHAPVGKGPNAGRLRDQIRYERTLTGSSLTIRYTSNTPYTGYVLHGTQPHMIRPRNARVLHWVNATGGHFARFVNHPGTKPNPFPKRAVQPLVPELQKRFKTAVEEVLKRG